MNSLHNTKRLKPPYGLVRTTEELGSVAREERKRQALTLDQIYSLSGLSTRFQSQFERGKPNASLCRVMDALQILGLDMVILPRSESARLLGIMRRSESG